MVIGSSWASADMRHLHARYGTDDRQPALPLPAGEPTFARNLILRYTAPGDWVLDPFVGGGTTAVEAALLGRQTIAGDLSAAAITTTQDHLAHLAHERTTTTAVALLHAGCPCLRRRRRQHAPRAAPSALRRCHPLQRGYRRRSLAPRLRPLPRRTPPRRIREPARAGSWLAAAARC